MHNLSGDERELEIREPGAGKRLSSSLGRLAKIASTPYVCGSRSGFLAPLTDPRGCDTRLNWAPEHCG